MVTAQWRAGLLGRMLGVHSPGGHIHGVCWCQRAASDLVGPAWSNPRLRAQARLAREYPVRYAELYDEELAHDAGSGPSPRGGVTRDS